MNTRKTRKQRQRGGGFFDTMRNSFRRLFTSDSGSVAPTTAPVTPAPVPAPVPVPAPAPAPAAITAPPAPINRRQNKINIVPPMPNQKSNELMIGGKRRRRRSRRNRN